MDYLTRHRFYEPLEMETNPVTLSFSGKMSHLESAFKEEYFLENLYHGRICHVLAIIFYGTVGILDGILFPEAKASFWVVRYAIVCPIFILGLIFSFSPLYKKYWQHIFTGYVIITGGGYITMIYLGTPPLSYSYYVGIIFCYIFGYTLIRLRFLYASLAGFINILVYEMVSIQLMDVPFSILLHNSFNLIGINILGMIVCYYIESSARKNFFLTYCIDLEKEKVKSANQELERRVAERTATLSEINEKLREEILERKRTENALRISENKFRDLYDNAPTPYFSVDPGKQKIVRYNASAINLLGYDHSDFFELHFSELWTNSANGLEKADQILHQLKNSETIRDVELQMKHKSNRPVWVSLSGKPVMENENKLVEYRFVAIDISRRKELEIQLQQAGKMEAIGTLAGGIAHDFNNILTSVIGYTELAMDHAKSGTIQESHLKEVLIASERAKSLIQHILTFSRQNEQKMRPIQPRPIIKQSLKLLRASLPTTIEIRQKVFSDSFILSDPTQLHQIIMNLCTNASHAMQNTGGVMEVVLDDEYLDEKFTSRQPGLQPGPHIVLTVRDTGEGIPTDIAERVFDPFFTTKEEGKGTGLGLSVVHGIVKRAGGDITVESQPGGGSTFKIYLPIVPKIPEPEIHQDEPLQTGTESILVIDDEFAVVNMIQQSLKSLGYQVEFRTSSIDAIEIIKSAPNQFDLVISDVTMPKMTGDVLAREVKNIRPDLPVILCSGFSGKLDEDKKKRLGIAGFLAKPILKRQLAETVRKALDRKDN